MPPPPLPPKKHSGRDGELDAMEKLEMGGTTIEDDFLSKSLNVNSNTDGDDFLSKSLPEMLFLFDPLINVDGNEPTKLVRGRSIQSNSGMKPIRRRDGGGVLRTSNNAVVPVVSNLLDLGGVDSNVEIETNGSSELHINIDKDLSTTTTTLNDDNSGVAPPLPARRKMKTQLSPEELRSKTKTLSPQDLQRFERYGTSSTTANKSNKSTTLPARPPRPAMNRFSCPPSVPSKSGGETSNDGRSKPPNHNNAHTSSQQNEVNVKESDTRKHLNKNNDNNNIYFTKSGLFQKTEERNEEAIAFSNSIAKLRKVYRHEDKKTNPGYISAPLIRNKALLDSSADVTIFFDPEYSDKPKVMNCKLSCTPVDLIHRFFTETLNDGKNGSSTGYELDIIAQQYVLKFVGATTCLTLECPLCDYVTVQECIKYGYPIELVLARTGYVNLDFKRDAGDDAEDCEATYFKYFFEEENDGGKNAFSISEQGLMVLLETYNNEAARLIQEVDDLHKISYVPERLIQVVKAIAKSLAQVELLSVQEGVNMLLSLKTFTVHDTQRINEFMNPIHFDRDRFHFALQTLTRGVHSMIELYCTFFNTDFKIHDFKDSEINDDGDSEIYERIDPRSIDDKFLVRIGAIHRIPSSWKQDFSEFEIETGIFYGGKPTCRLLKTTRSRVCVGFFEHIQFNKLLNFDLDVRSVPREAKVTFKLIGISAPKKGGDGRTVLGWVSANVYDHQGFLVSGSRLFGLLPAADVDFNPVATCATGYIQKADTVILKTDFQVYHTEVLFPEPMLITQQRSATTEGERRPSLSEAERSYMEKLMKKSSHLLTEEERQSVWNARHDLCHLTHALKHVLTSCPSWDPVNMKEVHLILSSWESLSPDEAIEFLQADFPDKIVREMAVLWLSSIGDDDLVDYLPELVQAVKYEAYHNSALAQFLIKRSLSSSSVCHFLFWHLKYYTGDMQFSQRFQIVLSGLLSACGRRMRSELQRQDRLIIELAAVSQKVKMCKESSRQYTLVKELEKINTGDFADFPVRLPINPALKLGGLLPEQSSYFSSHTVPLKISADNVDRRGRGSVDFIFKIGDDLRKDLVTQLMFRVMNKLWLNDGLDLRMMLYDVLPTGPMSGLIEIVPNSSTFREIHIKHGLTGSFKVLKYF